MATIFPPTTVKPMTETGVPPGATTTPAAPLTRAARTERTPGEHERLAGDRGSVEVVIEPPDRPGSPRSGDDPVARSVAVYSEHAADYEVTHAPKMSKAVARFAASLPVPSRILDAGCGPGRDLARFVAHGHVARGIDLNPVFVDRANAHAPTVYGDLRDVADQFAPGSFDGIWASASLVHLGESETVDVLAQFARLVRPGGELFACVKCAGETGWLDEPDGRRWYTVWDAARFAAAVAAAGFSIDDVAHDLFVEVWATRAG
jgi:SAM-dependent methyltransferase